MKGGIGWKLRLSGVERYMKVISDVPVPQEPENLRFAPVIIYFAFLIDIIDNIITYSLYTV